MLSVEAINVFYGKMHILHNVSLEVGREHSEMVALLGHNGVGKTTTLRAITGLTPPRSGQVVFDDHALNHTPTQRMAALGVGCVLQGQNVFPQLSVADNLRFNLAQDHRYEERLAQTFEYFPNLKQRLSQPARTLSGGERQMLAIARAWLARPRLILLDEPTEGLMPKLVWQVAEILRDMQQRSDINVLLVEQNVELALRFSDRLYVMEKGEIVFQARTPQVSQDDVLPYLEVGARD